MGHVGQAEGVQLAVMHRYARSIRARRPSAGSCYGRAPSSIALFSVIG